MSGGFANHWDFRAPSCSGLATLMKILLVGNYLNDKQESMQRFTTLMQEGLTQAGHEARVIRPAALIGRFSAGFRGLGKWLGYVDKFVIFPFSLRGAVRWADVVHICDHSNAIYTRFTCSRAHVVTCHDVLEIRSALGEFSQHRTRRTGRQLQRLILSGLKRSQYVVCVSQSTKNDFVRISGFNPDHLSLIQNGLNYPYSPMPPEEAIAHLGRLGIQDKQRFLFHVGGNQWYKNPLGVLQIFASLVKSNSVRDLKLVMVGKPWTQAMCQFVCDRGLEGKITRLTGVSNEELRALYSSAAALLFPSLQEGFGWPIVEAQACGCLVFTSNRAPMNDVGGRAAIYIDPEDAAGAARIIAQNLDSAGKLRIASIENAARFSTSAMISGYVRLYGSLLNETTSRN